MGGGRQEMADNRWEMGGRGLVTSPGGAKGEDGRWEMGMGAVDAAWRWESRRYE